MITRTQMPRQLRNKGGITNAVPREKYGLGSKLKERFRKLIPNELTDVAVAAAPFVAPFNPGIAGLMRGIGRFDQRGSISDALKQGVATFGFGKAAGYLGGAQSGDGFFGGQTFTKEGFSEGPVGRLFQGKTPGGDGPGDNTNIPKTINKGKTGPFEKVAEKVFENVPFSDKLPTGVKEKLLVGGITSAGTALYEYFTGGFEPPEPGESMEEYMARRRERVKSQMRQVMDSYYTPLRNPEYAAMSDEQKNNFIDGIVGSGMATGGRVGYQTGGITMANTLAENIRRNLANQAAFRQAINPSQQKVLQRLQANQPKSSPLETFAKHAMVSEAMKGKTGMNVIPEYALQTGADFQKKFSNLNPKVSAGLAAAYQTLQEGSRAILDGPGGVTLKDAYDTALDQTTKNIEGILAADSGNLTAKQIEDRNKYLKQQGQPTEEIPGAISQEGIIPGFKRIGERSYQGPDGQIYGPETYASIAAGMYPNIYDPNKKVIPAEPPRKIIPEEGTIGPITKLPVEPDPDTPIDELVKPIMPTLPVEPRTDQQILEGFAKFKEQNPGIGAGPGLQVMIYGRLPDGTPLTFGNSAQANAFNQYLESIGQPPFERVSGDIRKITDNEEKSLSKLATGGMPVGIMRTNKAGVMERDYRDKGGFVPVGIKEKADDVPAMLSKNEFVFTADAVRGAGNGSIEKGAQKMYDTMKKLEKRVV